MFTKLGIFLCTCRCEPVTEHTNVCNFIRSITHYHTVVSNESEAILESLSDLTRSKSNKCNQFIAFFLCYYLFRNCELHNTSDPTSGLQLSICKSKCSDLYKVGSECLDESDFHTALEISKYNKAVHEIVAWAFNFSCSNPTTYAVPGVPISNISCDNVSFIDGLLPIASKWRSTGHTLLYIMQPIAICVCVQRLSFNTTIISFKMIVLVFPLLQNCM